MKFPQHDYEDSGLPGCYCKDYWPLHIKDLSLFVTFYYPLNILTFQKTRIVRKELFQSGRQTTQGCLYYRFMVQHLGCVYKMSGDFWQYFGTLLLRSSLVRSMLWIWDWFSKFTGLWTFLFRCACASRHEVFQWGNVRTLCMMTKEAETRKQVSCW
jgi:hypothetical protein